MKENGRATQADAGSTVARLALGRMAPKKKPATNAAGAKKSTKQQEKEQREQIKKQLVEIDPSRKGRWSIASTRCLTPRWV